MRHVRDPLTGRSTARAGRQRHARKAQKGRFDRVVARFMMLSGSALVDETADQPGTAEPINGDMDSFREAANPSRLPALSFGGGRVLESWPGIPK
jgi:hypothetical protein